LLLAMAGVLAAGTLFQLWLAQSWDLENLESLEGARLRGIAATTAAHVDGAAHEAAVRAHPPRGTMRAWTDAPDPARDLHAQLANVAGHAGLGGPVSTLRLRDAARADVLAAPDAVHPDAMEAVASSGSTPAWRTSLAYRPEMAEALFEGVPAATQVRDREDRAMVGAYAPITDDAGRVVAILGVEHPFAAHQAGHDARSAAQVGSAILSGGIGLIILALAGRRFGQGLSVAEAAARTMASGDFKTPVDAGGFTEVTFLAGALEDVRTATAARFGQLEKLARQRAHQRDLALRGINPEAIRRRTAFAELGDAIDVAVSVGGRRPRRIHLVDLSYDEASILTTADIDLAPGTPLRVRIACKDSGQRVRLPATVFARMDQGETAVEYRVRLGVNGALVDFPFSVARIMNGRQAPRVAPTVEHPVRATLI
ncbi:MAG: hypothetical protein VX000_04545, partial [Myxococcota bacterium]|nr:hypothetical protein [Myxococcota bacterium]